MIKNLYAVADRAVGNPGPGTHDGIFSDHRRPFQHHVRITHRILPNGDPGTDPWGGRIDNPDAGIEPAMTDLSSHDLFGFDQLGPCVDAEALVRILEPKRRHSPSPPHL